MISILPTVFVTSCRWVCESEIYWKVFLHCDIFYFPDIIKNSFNYIHILDIHCVLHNDVTSQFQLLMIPTIFFN